MSSPALRTPSIVRVDLPLTEERDYQCPLCEKCYVRAPSLRTHVIEKHHGRAVFRYQCRDCDAVLNDTTKRLLETHQRVCIRRHQQQPTNETQEDDGVEAAVADFIAGIRRELFPSPIHVPESPPLAAISPELERAARLLEELLESPEPRTETELIPPTPPNVIPLPPTHDAPDRHNDDDNPATDVTSGSREREENITADVPWDHQLRQQVGQLPDSPQRIRSVTYRRGGRGRPYISPHRRNVRVNQATPPEIARPQPATVTQPAAAREENRDADDQNQPIPSWNQEHGQLDLPARRRPASPPHRGCTTGRHPRDQGTRTTTHDNDDQRGSGEPERLAAVNAATNLTPQQLEWLAALQATGDDDIDGVSEVSRQLTTAAAIRIEPGQNRLATSNTTRNNQRAFLRRPPPARPTYDAASASTLQKLYRVDKKKAINQILGGPNPHCEIDPNEIHRHLAEMFAGQEHIHSAPPESVPDINFPSSNDETSTLLANITPAQVAARLARMSNTAPGLDGARYSGLKRVDPGCHVMSAIFNCCLKQRRVPKEWKEAKTILIHKSGNRDDLGNWRPLSLGNTIGKLYTAILADRIAYWAEDGGRLSLQQKGFTSYDGCLEHNFIVQTAIDDARRNGKELCIAWLDLANAFPSVPHSHLFGVLQMMGLPTALLNIIRDLYTDSSTRIMTKAGLSDPVPVTAGVKQGCPLSPIIFNLGMEPLIRSLASTNHGYRLGNERINVLAFADDLVCLAENEVALQNELDIACDVAAWSGLTLKPRKCASLHIGRSRTRNRIQPTVFTVDDNPITTLADGEHYKHLGVPTGFRTRQTPTETIQQLSEDLQKIDESLLAPWQKIDATATFMIPRMDFILRGANVAMEPLRTLDRQLKKLTKRWLHLPQRASAEPVFIAPAHGGAGLLPISDNRYIMSVVQGYRLLTCPDSQVQKIAWWSLRKVASRKIGRQASNEDLAEYLNGISEGDGGDISCIWSRVRRSTKELKKTTRIDWWWNTTLKELQLLVPKPGGEPDVTRVHPAARRHLCYLLRTAVRAAYLRRLTEKPDQGKVYDVSTRWTTSNHMMRTGTNTRFADWRFLHRARLDCVPLNGSKRFNETDKRCRRCGHANETLPHVLSCCNKHTVGRQLRHHSIVNRLAKAVPRIAGEVRTDRQVPGTDSSLRPDIVVTNQSTKQMTIIDVAVVFENRYEALEVARLEKIRKYQEIANHFRMRGWTVRLDAVIVGALGSWDPANEPALKALRISPRYCRMMRKFIVSDTIRWSRDIYVEHLSGRRQFSIPSATTTEHARTNEPPPAAAPLPDLNANNANEPNDSPVHEPNTSLISV